MKVSILAEAGYEPALLGLSLSHNAPLERMPAVAARLAFAAGHNKFLRQIRAWFVVREAPREWWMQFMTHGLGREISKDDITADEVTVQSGSTMHNLLKRPIVPADFAEWDDDETDRAYLAKLNRLREQRQLMRVKKRLPEGYMQDRVFDANYATLQNLVAQRATHRDPNWSILIAALRTVEHPEFIFKD